MRTTKQCSDRKMTALCNRAGGNSFQRITQRRGDEKTIHLDYAQEYLGQRPVGTSVPDPEPVLVCKRLPGVWSRDPDALSPYRRRRE